MTTPELINKKGLTPYFLDSLYNAVKYMKIAEQEGFKPIFLSDYCPIKELGDKFNSNFDIVNYVISNGMDETYVKVALKYIEKYNLSEDGFGTHLWGIYVFAEAGFSEEKIDSMLKRI